MAAALSAPRDLAFFSSPSPTNSSPPPTAYSSAASYWRSFTERHAKLADAIRALSSTTSQAEAAAAASMLSKVPAGLVAWMMDFFPYLALAPQFNALVAPIVSVHGAGNSAVPQTQGQTQVCTSHNSANNSECLFRHAFCITYKKLFGSNFSDMPTIYQEEMRKHHHLNS